MATSGYTDVAVTNSTTLRFTWSLNGQSVASNYSDISWSMLLITNAYGSVSSTASKSWSVNVDGQGFSGTNTVSIGTNSTKTLASGTKTIYHNSDGSKHFDYSFSQQFNINFASGYVGTVSGSGGEWLPTIARASQPSVSSSNVTMSNTITIYTNRASSSFTHNVYYNWQGNNYTSGLSASSGIGDSISFTPPKTLANYMTGSQSGTCTIYCDTYSGGSYIGTKTCTVTISISSDIKPTVSATVTDSNGYAQVFGGYVVGKSKYKVQLTESGSYGSSVSSRTVNMNALIYTTNPAESNAILASSYNTIVCQVKDSRTVYSDLLTINTTVLDYTVPIINSFGASRCNGDGTANDDGEYVKVTYDVSITPLNNINTKSLKVKYKKVSDSTFTEQSISLTSYNQSGNVIIGANGLYSYEFVLLLNDYFNVPVQKSISVSTAFTLLDYYKDGTGISLGKVAEHSNLFECDLPAKFNKGITNLAQLQSDSAHPVGSLYFSEDSTSPATLFGGTWLQLAGYFLYAASSGAGNTGGSMTTGGTAITSNQMPWHTHIQDAHSHGQDSHNHAQDSHYHNVGRDTDGAGGTSRYTVHGAGSSGAQNQSPTSWAQPYIYPAQPGIWGSTATNQYTGGGQAHTHTFMPSNRNVYCWKRTA